MKNPEHNKPHELISARLRIFRIQSLIYLSSLCILTLLFFSIRNHNSLVDFDTAVDATLSANRTASGLRFFAWITVIAKGNVITVFIASFFAVLWFGKKKAYIMPTLIVVVGAGLTSEFSKFILKRQRPQGSIPAYIESTFSFPSGHATASAAFFGFLIFIFWNERLRTLTKVVFSIICIVLILSIGFSRIYLGVHYPSDVLGGFLVGLLWVNHGVFYFQWRYPSHNLIQDLTASAERSYLALLILLVSIAYYVFYCRGFVFAHHL